MLGFFTFFHFELLVQKLLLKFQGKTKEGVKYKPSNVSSAGQSTANRHRNMREVGAVLLDQ